MKRILMMAVLTALVLGWAMGSLAAPNTSEIFKPKAQVWHRFEADNRDFNSAAAVKTFNLARTRLSLMVTPTPDMVTQSLFAAPMVVLYLLSILIAAIFGKKKDE